MKSGFFMLYFLICISQYYIVLFTKMEFNIINAIFFVFILLVLSYFRKSIIDINTSEKVPDFFKGADISKLIKYKDQYLMLFNVFILFITSLLIFYIFQNILGNEVFAFIAILVVMLVFTVFIYMFGYKKKNIPFKIWSPTIMISGMYFMKVVTLLI